MLRERRILSHPGRDLMDHLRGVSQILKVLGHPYPEIVGMTHDILKAHPRFQNKIRGRGSSFPHAPGSALITYGMLLQETGDEEEALLHAETVRLHHMGMPSLRETREFWYNYDNLRERAEPLYDVVDYIREYVWEDVDIAAMVQDMERLEDRNISGDTLFVPSMDAYVTLRRYLSMLITADRIDAVYAQDVHESEVLPSLPPEDASRGLDNIMAFITHAPDTNINRWRNRIRDMVLSRFGTRRNKGVYRLELPTGAGKTLISLWLALDAVRRIDVKRIVYVLPFISTGEQVADVAIQMLGEATVKVDNYLKKAEMSPDDLNPRDVVSFIMRYWNRPVVVTTAVYMWDVLFGPSAMDTMNFHLLRDAAIIFDEVQAIPASKWDDMAQMAERLGKDNLVILMSATHPIHVRESISISAGREEIPPRYEVEMGDLPTPEELRMQVEEKGSVLVIFNTRRAARDYYMSVRKAIPREYLFFLSTYVVPKERRDIIRRLRRAEKTGQKRILISTQVVEAGVDLSFAVLYRQVAPLDSVLQSAGRCGRHGEVKGRVVIFPDDGNMGRVYGVIKKDVTLQLLPSVEGSEWKLHTLVDQYFAAIRDRKALSEIVSGAISEGVFNMSTVKYHIIEDQHTFPIVIPKVNGEDVWWIIDKLGELSEVKSEDKFRILNQKRVLYAKLSPYIVNIPKGIWEKLDKSNHFEAVGDEGVLLVVTDEFLHRYYHPEVGWNWFGEDE